MRKFLCICLTFFIFSILMEGCSFPKSDENDANSTAQSEFAERTPNKDVKHSQEIPEWATASIESISLFDGLNLDGTGMNDDECSIAVYRWGEIYPGIISLCVKLGTGDTFAKIVPADGAYSFNVGHIFSPDKDAIILEVESATSNLGVARVYAYEICEDGDAAPKMAMVERLNTDKLDTTLYESQSASGKIGNGFITLAREGIETTGIITDGTTVVDLDGSLQGITLFFTGKENMWRECSLTLYWENERWNQIS